ncbi:hypothetical protein CDG77_01615 [Nostoc sp. 'Peltigera membranacea cyanobiont' 213]|nr:hypothetical protein CDG77_01615 [Nostoc sp. 'Peltigera membranacea cyanobiont' 213]
MFIDSDNDSPKAEAVDIKLSLKEIFDLHDLRWETEPITDPVLPELAMGFAKLHTDKKVVIAWHWWCDNVLKPGTKVLKKKSNKSPEWEWKKEVDSGLHKVNDSFIVSLSPDIAIQKLNEELKKILTQEEGKTLLENLQQENFKKIKGLCDYYNNLWNLDHIQYIEKIGNLLQKYLEASPTELALKKASEKASFEKIKHLCEWLQGNWLEHYMLQQIQEVSKANPELINDTGLSFKVRDKKKQEEKKDKFEFDVAFMKGYQLFALSCTTDASKSLCKSKLFEAYIRAQQLGGQQARVALVCCYEHPKELEDELKVDTEVVKEDPRIIVFGCEHLDNIQKSIKDWIDENNRYYAP